MLKLLRPAAQICRRVQMQLKPLHKLCGRLGAVICNFLYIYTEGDTGISEMDSATGSI